MGGERYRWMNRANEWERERARDTQIHRLRTNENGLNEIDKSMICDFST